MRAYVCVYRHPIPRPIDRRRTEKTAAADQFLRRYLDLYDRADHFYDWGDDPSFYSAIETLGEVRRATWGVCRRDVRSWLAPVITWCSYAAGNRLAGSGSTST